MSALVQVVIFGASGDLTRRKLVPALTSIAAQTKGPLQVVGVSRRPKTDQLWRDELSDWIAEDQAMAYAELRDQVFYRSVDSTAPHQVVELRAELDRLAEANGHDVKTVGRLYYLALKPDLFAPTVAHLHAAGLLQEEPDHGFRRVVVEKPFGRDLGSARVLNTTLHRYLREHQIFRIDHYLGKETVQNILALRFQNAIFEPLWSRDHVESVEITVAESIGVEGGRGAYYDQAGALRDMLQNHVLQVLALVAMEPPASMQAEDIRTEKVKVLSNLDLMSPGEVARDVVRAQYSGSEDRTLGYLDEDGVAEDSLTETFVAIRAGIHNWRWSGVPFLLRTGKCLPKRYTEVVLRFRVPPVDLLSGPRPADCCPLRPNELHIYIQPKEGIKLTFQVKQPGPGSIMRSANLGFDYQDLWEGRTPPAYQRLLRDAIEGDATLFLRGDETEAAWRFVDSIRGGWMQLGQTELPSYAAGSWGPDEAQNLFRGCEGTWGVGE